MIHFISVAVYAMFKKTIKTSISGTSLGETCLVATGSPGGSGTKQ